MGYMGTSTHYLNKVYQGTFTNTLATINNETQLGNI